MAQYKTGQEYYTDTGTDTHCFAVCQDGSTCEVRGTGCYCDCGGNPYGDPWGRNARCQCYSSPRPPPVKEGGLMRRGGITHSPAPSRLRGGSTGGKLVKR